MVTMLEQTFYLSEMMGRNVYLKSVKTGKLEDFVIVETGKVPEVTHLVVSRSFGYPSLLLPWDKIAIISNTEIVADIIIASKYETPIPEGSILLKDHILDKKILDMDDHEVEVVYDIKLELQHGKLYVSEVDFSRQRLLRRLGLRKLANFMGQHSKNNSVSWMFVQPLPQNIGSFSGDVKLSILKEKIHDIHPVDLADILEELDNNQRLILFNQLNTELASETLEEIEPRVQRELIDAMGKVRTAELLNEMSPAQAADVLGALPASDSDEILELIDKKNAPQVQQLIDKHDENIVLYMTHHFIKLPPTKLVHEVMKNYRQLAKDMDVIMYVYVTDEADTLLGVIDIRELIQAEEDQTLAEIMTDSIISLSPDQILADAIEMFSRYSFRAIPVIYEDDKLLGVVSQRDIKGIKSRL
jgi:magnesium transporter